MQGIAAIDSSMEPAECSLAAADEEGVTKQKTEELLRAIHLIRDNIPESIISRSELARAVEYLVSRQGAGSTDCKSEGSDHKAQEIPKKKSNGAVEDEATPTEKRQLLTTAQAIEIFLLRPQPSKDGVMRRGSMLHCKSIAPRYSVTPKTIRDIWNGRTWSHATKHLWTKWEKQRRTYFMLDDSDNVPHDDHIGFMGGDHHHALVAGLSGANEQTGGVVGGIPGGRGPYMFSGGGGGGEMGAFPHQSFGPAQGIWPFMGPPVMGGGIASQPDHPHMKAQAVGQFFQMQHLNNQNHTAGYPMALGGGGYPQGGFPGGMQGPLSTGASFGLGHMHGGGLGGAACFGNGGLGIPGKGGVTGVHPGVLEARARVLPNPTATGADLKQNLTGVVGGLGRGQQDAQYCDGGEASGESHGERHA